MIAGGEQFALASASARPDRADGMDDIFAGQAVGSGDPCVAGRAATEGAAFGKQFRSGCAMDAAIDSAAAQQRIVCSVAMASTLRRVISPQMIFKGIAFLL